ncbi:malonate decarboxylase holo-[acyl-carrier-protein] synthase [Acetobacter indonesiensis]|uniref:malonate decarboxylase holo-[acyl-carrier-protein] synthase n=1 Tax=Acetobacter indonesiensis TaxID=104101 RepID=UPI000A3B8BF2|nr:malonate decarboxylase holo-[acyl-carrier-protein] synthase [Acetobacter indonesiensis]
MLSVWRHKLLVVRPDVWRGICATVQQDVNDAATQAIVQDWMVKEWPVICRRPYAHEQNAEDGSGIAVGLPLPPIMGKKRLGFVVPEKAISSFAGAMWPCGEVSSVGLTPERLNDIKLLTELGRAYGLVPQATGSLLWETITGLPYLSETSDFDVIWRVAGSNLQSAEILAAFLEDLTQIAGKLSVRLDGEIIFPHDRAVQWRELQSAHSDEDVLVKTLTSVELVPVRTLVGSLRKVPA